MKKISILARKAVTAYGPELFTNGAFDTDLTGWNNLDSWWTWVSNEAYHPSTPDYKAFLQTPATVNGKSYKLVFDLTLTAGEMKVVHKNGADANVTNAYSNSGTKEIEITDIRTTSPFTFSRNTGTTEFSIDNVSCKEIL